MFQGRPKEGLFPLLIVVGYTSDSCNVSFSIFMIAVEKHFEVPTFDYWIGASFDLKNVAKGMFPCVARGGKTRRCAFSLLSFDNFELGCCFNLNTLLHALFENLCSSNSDKSH